MARSPVSASSPGLPHLPRASSSPRLGASVPDRAAEPASGHARSQVPLSCPRMPAGPTPAQQAPRQILSALRACLFLPGEDRGDSVPTYRPRALCQPRTPLAPRLTHELLQSSISWFAYLGVSILRICQSHDLIFFFFFKEDLFHLPLVNPCWKLLKSPDNGK